MNYALATINYHGRAAPVIEVAGIHWLLAEVAPELLQPHIFRGLMSLFDHWQEREPRLAELAQRLVDSCERNGRVEPKPQANDFLAPLLYPNKLLLIGANYYDHLRNDAGINDFKKEEKIPIQHCIFSGEAISDFLNRNVIANCRRHHPDRLHLGIGHGEGNKCMRVAVANGHNIAARLVNAAVDVALRIHGTAALLDWIAVEIKLHNVTFDDELRTARARQEIAPGYARMSNTDVAECIYNAFAPQDPIGDDQLVDGCINIRQGSTPVCWSGRDRPFKRYENCGRRTCIRLAREARRRSNLCGVASPTRWRRVVEIRPGSAPASRETVSANSGLRNTG